RAQLQPHGFQLQTFVASDKDDRHLRQRRIALECLAHFKAAELGHVNIQQHQIGNGFTRQLERHATRSCESKWCEVAEDAAQDANHHGVVVDKKTVNFFGTCQRV